MTKLSKSFSTKLFIILLIIIAVFTVIHVTLQYINLTHVNQTAGNFFEATNRFDFDDEASIPTWFSNILFLLLAFFAFLAAKLDTKKIARKRLWIVVGIVSILGSLDEVSTVHETGLQGLHLLFFDENTPTLLANAWIVIIPAVLFLAGLFFYYAVKHLPRKTIYLLAIAVSVYLFGAVGIDILTSVIESSEFIKQGVLVAIEEVAELVGLSIAIYGISSYIEANYSDKIKKAITNLS